MASEKQKLKAVLFDFDGVVMDSETTLFESWQRTYAAFGCELPLELWAANVGGYNYDVFDPLAYIEQQTGLRIDREVVNGARRSCYLLRVHKLDAMPGVREAITAVKNKGLQLAAVSSSSQNWVPVHLKRLGLYDSFDVVVCGNEVEMVKPDPALYHLALNRLRLSPKEVFVVEDSPKGIAAARAAGLYCIAVPNPVTRASKLAGYDKLLGGLHEHPFEVLIDEIEDALTLRHT